MNNTADSIVKDIYGSSKISLAPSIASGLNKKGIDSKLLFLNGNGAGGESKYKKDQRLMRVKPLPINYSMNARNAGSVLPALKPISISPEPRGSLPIVPHASVAKRNSSIDETNNNIHISNNNNNNNSNNINSNINNSPNINNNNTIKTPGNHK